MIILKELPFSAPKAQEDVEGRVRQLSKFFSVVATGDFKAISSVKRDMLETPTAMHLLRNEIKHKPNEFKCNKYFKLIKTPIKTSAVINSIIEDQRISFEVQNFNINIIEGLINEKRYDPLSRITGIIESLEQEKWRGRSLYDIDMQNELIGCLSYFIYRHQNALNSVADYVQKGIERLRPDLDQPRTSDELEAQIDAAIKEVIRIEEQSQTNFDLWLSAMEKLGDKVIEAKFNVQPEFSEFIEQRMKDLDRQENTKEKLDIAMNTVLNIESNRRSLNEIISSENQTNNDVEYKNALTTIFAIGESPPGRFKKLVDEFLRHNDRSRFVERSEGIETYKNEIKSMIEAEEKAKEEEEKRKKEEEAARHNAKKKNSVFRFFRHGH